MHSILRHLALAWLLAMSACGSSSSEPTGNAPSSKTEAVSEPGKEPADDGTADSPSDNPGDPGATPDESPTTGKWFERVLIVVMENEDQKAVLSNAYYQSLADRGAFFSNSRGVARPSYPNYLALIAGETFGVRDSIQRTFPDAMIADLLEARQLDWRNYVEDYPGDCYLGDTFIRNARKHVPFLSFSSVQNDTEACAKVVDEDQWKTDLGAGKLPAFMLYTPDLDHDGHDTGIDGGATWLDGFLEPLLADSEFMAGTLVVVTFDESAIYSEDDRIFTVFLGPMVKARVVRDRPFDHYSLLRTIEDNFELGTLGKHDDTAKAVTDVWR